MLNLKIDLNLFGTSLTMIFKRRGFLICYKRYEDNSDFFDDDFRMSVKQKIANNIRSYSG